MLVDDSLKNSDLRTNPRQRHSKQIIKEAVANVESGISRLLVCKDYRISMSCLSNWMRLYGSEDYHRNKPHSFTVQQKRSILRHIEQGEMTMRQAMSVYNTGESTIYSWHRQCKQEDTALNAANTSVMQKLSTNTNLSGTNSLELEKALAEAKLKIAALETMIDLAEQQFKIKIRKKSGAKQSPK